MNHSVCAGWLSVPLQPWFFGYSHVNILDVLWKARYKVTTLPVILMAPKHSISGYVSTRVFLSIGGQDWQKNIFFTATVLPTLVIFMLLWCQTYTELILQSFVFAFMFLINLFLIGSKSAGAVPFGTQSFTSTT